MLETGHISTQWTIIVRNTDIYDGENLPELAFLLGVYLSNLVL